MSFGTSGDRFPTGAAASARAAGVKPQSRNGHENMTISHENTNPVSISFFSVVEEATGGHLALHEACLAQDV